MLAEATALAARRRRNFRARASASMPARMRGQSSSVMANQAVSRFLPFTTMCWRKIPSKPKPKRTRGAARRLVRGVAFPFEAAIAEVVEGVAREEVERIGGDTRARDRRPPENAADLDDAVLGRDAHQRLPALGAAGGRIDDGVEQRIGARRRARRPCVERRRDRRAAARRGSGSAHPRRARPRPRRAHRRGAPDRAFRAGTSVLRAVRPSGRGRGVQPERSALSHPRRRAGAANAPFSVLDGAAPSKAKLRSASPCAAFRNAPSATLARPAPIETRLHAELFERADIVRDAAEAAEHVDRHLHGLDHRRDCPRPASARAHRPRPRRPAS